MMERIKKTTLTFMMFVIDKFLLGFFMGFGLCFAVWALRQMLGVY